MSKKREQKKQKRLIFGLVAMGVFAVVMVTMIIAMGNSVSEIREAEVAHSPAALLANSGAKEDKWIALPVTYYDQISDECVDLYDAEKQTEVAERQWEWKKCGYNNGQIERGLVEEKLGENGLPVAKGTKVAKVTKESEGASSTEKKTSTAMAKVNMIPNRGVNFMGWFEEVEGVSDESKGTLSMRYQKEGADFSFAAEDFYPLDAVKFSAEDPVNADGHNHLFTLNFVVPFTVLGSGEETFLVRADDDTFVFVDEQLVVDMGGVHGAMTGEMLIDSDGQVYSKVEGGEWTATGVKLAVGEATQLAVFHADRDSSESTFELGFSGMNLALASGAKIASVSGTEAATGAGMEYVEPLGESKVFEPETANMILIVATVEGVMVVLAAVLVVGVARFVIRQKVG